MTVEYKGKRGTISIYNCRQGDHLFLTSSESISINHRVCDTRQWDVKSMVTFLALEHYPLAPNYTAWWQRQTCERLPKAIHDSAVVMSQTRDLSIMSLTI